jgi:hypothetical protein
MLISRPTGRGRLPLLTIIASVCLGASLSGCSQINSPNKPTNMTMTKIHGDADWYQSRSEQEREWRGEFRERAVTAGPATRTALKYQLVTTDEQLPVYAANVEEKLAPFVGKQVLVHGKLVGPDADGSGKELWIASIRTLP